MFWGNFLLLVSLVAMSQLAMRAMGDESMDAKIQRMIDDKIEQMKSRRKAELQQQMEERRNRYRDHSRYDRYLENEDDEDDESEDDRRSRARAGRRPRQDRGRERSFSRASRSSRRAGAKKGSSASASKYSDRGALHHMDHSEAKADILRNRIKKNGHLFESHEHDSLHQELEEYLKLEHNVAARYQKMGDDYEKARDILDRDKRRAYLDQLRQQRETRREQDLATRKIARDKYLSIKDKIDLKTDREL